RRSASPATSSHAATPLPRWSGPTATTRWTAPASWPMSSSSSAPCNHDMTKAIVIGSGAGGSFAAMELAKAGWDVIIFEKGPNHFQQRSALGPFPGADVADWPFTYHDLAPYYDEVEQLIGVQGDTATFPDLVHKHAPRTSPYPMPPGPQMRASTAVATGAAAIG